MIMKNNHQRIESLPSVLSILGIERLEAYGRDDRIGIINPSEFIELALTQGATHFEICRGLGLWLYRNHPSGGLEMLEISAEWGLPTRLLDPCAV